MSLSRHTSSESMEVASNSSTGGSSTSSGATSPDPPTAVQPQPSAPKRSFSTEKLILNGSSGDSSRYENRDGLAHDLSFLATMPELCDVTFLVGEDRQPVCGVKAILAARSRVFRRMLYGDRGGGGNNSSSSSSSSSGPGKKTKKLKPSKSLDGYIEKYDFKGQPTVVVKDFEPEVFKQLVEYTHTGCVMLQARTLLGLMNAADHYGLEELKVACIRFMEHCVTVDTVCSLLISAEKYIQYKSTKILVQKMFEFVDQNAEKILTLGAFAMLPQHVVRIVLSRDDLNACETTKCEAAIRWSLRYAEEHAEVSIQQAFEPFIDVIDFYLIPAKNLMKSVKPSGVVADAVILNALAYQADPKSIEHKPLPRRRTPTPCHERESPQFRRVQSSGQPLNQSSRENTPTRQRRFSRGGSVPAYTPSPPARASSQETLHLRGDVHPTRVHDTTRERFDSQDSSSHFSESPLLSPSAESYQSSVSSLERDNQPKKKLTYNSLDTVVTLSSNTAVEV